MNIVLFNPLIPPNTGDIGRNCIITNSKLHIIKPMGFSLDSKEVKKRGLDYWEKVDVSVYEDFDDFLEKAKPKRVIMATTKTNIIYSDMKYDIDDFIMFGSESYGIPEEILVNYKETCVRIPMFGNERSLSLPNSAAVVMYEVLRQNNFEGLNTNGELHRLEWE